VSRSVLANVETGHRPPTAPLVAALIAAFPEESDAIEQGFFALRTTPTPGAEISLLQARVHQLLAYGRRAEAILAVTNGLKNLSAPADQAALNRTLADLHFLVGNVDAGFAALRATVEAYADAGLDAEAIPTITHIAGQLFRRGRLEEASRLTSARLQSFPEASELWRIRGTVAWYEHHYADAYASLTTALHLGSPRRIVLNARGQVLAEWGNCSAALTDLQEALSNSDSPALGSDGGVAEAALPHGRAYALSAMAYCHWLLGQQSRALLEFEEASAVTPDNAWLYFRWAQ
jgi:tetratricopeptide (TPR) repeat protein